eukprot:TRINITY_DN14065_c0_g1_i2.p1 TRINITY_DN14065_c0_g1~~TRINITY_DN14065_c0_g1_i2.p1  ORF type:complete len:579 (-),score=83.30 TRINITY_DN14065_c0_g1_i2:848-2584(-)
MIFDEKNKNKIYLFLILAFVLIYIVPLGFRPLIVPDETRYAQIPREIVQSGDWVVPRLGGLRYFEKPIMGYWLNAISQLIFGENNFAVRFMSAFTTGLSALMLFWFVRKLKGFEAAVWTTMIFMISSLVYYIGTFAVLDPHTSMFLTGALITFYLAYDAKKVKVKLLWLAAFGAFCGGAFLAKGFIAFAVPGVTIAPFLIYKKKWKEILWMPWIPFVVAVLVSLPWAIMIHYREPDFWNYFFWVEHIQRAIGSESGQHPEPFWYFIPVIIGGTIPWTFLAPAIFSVTKFRIPKDDLLLFCVCWTIFPFIFFSIPNGKLGTYILPLYPGLAYLLCVGLRKYFAEGNIKIFNICCKVIYIILIVGAVGFAAHQVLSVTGISAKVIALFSSKELPQTALYMTHEYWKWLVALAMVAVWIVLLYRAAKTENAQKKFVYFFSGPLMVFFIGNMILPDFIRDGKAPEHFLMKYADKVPDDAVIVVYKNLFPEVSWYYNRTDLYVFHKGGELEYGLGYLKGSPEYPDGRRRLISKEKLEEMTRDPQYKGKLVFIMRSKRKRESVPTNVQFEVYDPDRGAIMFAVY